MPLFNIFSKKPLKKASPAQKIIVDNREKNSLVIAELINLNLSIEYKQLPIADYLIGEIAIERKTAQDLVSSTFNKRIFSQLKNLKQYENPLLIIENYKGLNFSEIKLNENAIRGLMLSISLDYKIPIMFSKDEKETAILLSLIAKKKKTEISLRAKIKRTDSEILQFVLEGFPGIGPKTSKILLEKYKTVKQAINAQEDELKTLLGQKKSEKFLYFLNKFYREI